MSDWDEMRMEAAQDYIDDNMDADSFISQGKDEMKGEVIKLLDEMIADKLRFTYPQIGALMEARAKIQAL